MRNKSFSIVLLLIIPGSLFLNTTPLSAQSLLEKKISLSVSNQSVKNILNKISQKENFYFSYNSNRLPEDSLLSLDIHQKSVREVLTILLGNSYTYVETGDYIIIRSRSNKQKIFVISGKVINKKTGKEIPYASVYDKRQLTSTLTNEHGFFKLRVHSHSAIIPISISKLYYHDTSYIYNTALKKNVIIPISPIRSIVLDSVTVTPYSKLGNTWFGKFFISSKQTMQDINLSSFFVRQPFQYSLVPGIGTHGKMSAQVENKFSMNILGGYSAGVNGVELGGLFNIDKKDVQYFQVAGVFNTVGGSVKGLQASGIFNDVLGSVTGFQIAGISNIVKGRFTGFQAGGIINTAKNINGLQLAGVGNISKTTVDGVQIAGLLNITKKLKGLQIGVINVADSSTGYSIGILNFIHNGYHKFSISYNDALDFNIAYKSGNKKLYSILSVGTRFGKNKKVYALGYGFGHTSTFTPSLSLTTELVQHIIYNGNWDALPQLTRLQPSLQIRLSEGVSIFAGPSFSIFYKEATPPAKGYGSLIPSKNVISFSEQIKGWIGGQIGITLF